MWEIDRDYINDEYNKRVGMQGYSTNVGLGPILPEWIDLPTANETTRFRMKDDDGQVCYGGWLHNDDEGLNQSAALDFGMRDAGCTTIEVKVDEEWKQEIS